jgi:hypothetical protein
MTVIPFFLYILTLSSPRFLCRPRLFVRLAGALGRQSALHKENSGFAALTLGRHISTLRGYRILFSIRNPYIIYQSLHQSFLYSFTTILQVPSESGVTLDYGTILPWTLSFRQFDFHFRTYKRDLAILTE